MPAIGLLGRQVAAIEQIVVKAGHKAIGHWPILIAGSRPAHPPQNCRPEREALQRRVWADGTGLKRRRGAAPLDPSVRS
jgi:hypothetical protein